MDRSNRQHILTELHDLQNRAVPATPAPGAPIFPVPNALNATALANINAAAAVAAAGQPQPGRIPYSPPPPAYPEYDTASEMGDPPAPVSITIQKPLKIIGHGNLVSTTAMGPSVQEAVQRGLTAAGAGLDEWGRQRPVNVTVEAGITVDGSRNIVAGLGFVAKEAERRAKVAKAAAAAAAQAGQRPDQPTQQGIGLGLAPGQMQGHGHGHGQGHGQGQGQMQGREQHAQQAAAAAATNHQAAQMRGHSMESVD
ncbi:MAG: hypothetical protein M1825_003523 [Sarcosagium campestre]|nr:MAG: hypothetical protein M1825_003523 [Sarcosagium campestre]